MNHEGHEGHEERDVADLGWTVQMRNTSPLSLEAERAMHATIGCAIAVHQALGPGYLESIYKKAMAIELDSRRVPFERERAVDVIYREIAIPGQRVDLIVGGLIVVELKAIERFTDVHRAQLISYLKTTGLRGGLLVNFRVRRLKDGLQRIVL